MSLSNRRTRVSRGTSLLATVVLVPLFVSSCSDPSEPLSPSTSVTTMPPTTPVIDAWRYRYSAEELDVYDKALSRWDAYKRAIQPHNAAGKATAAAKRVYQEFVIPWQVYFQRLKSNESAGVTIARQARVLESSATRIVVDPSGSSVTIEECVDASDIGAAQDGKPVLSAFDQPQLSTVIMAEVDGRWLVSDIPNATEDRPCEAPE